MKRVFLAFILTVVLASVLVGLAITGDSVKDPVCGMEVDAAKAAASCEGKSGNLYFCSDHCKEAFCKNPEAYLSKKELDKLGLCEEKGKKEEKKGCGSCQSTKKEAGCDGKCGQTKVDAINHFHTYMHPLHEAVAKGDIDAVKKGRSELADLKSSVMNANCPEGACSHSFKSAKTAFGEKVDALLVACDKGDNEKIKQAFEEMHTAYEALDHTAR
ncbi:hypothetical protein CEE37_07285 [candidate division LCP-89 bacterium B3_LCP]|uniref:TRASH domain-containing protein n=1 Tax=candidate division LCP-89 bacterium B3_LCP TaxID=2012998 RepID=A0A532V0M3_UNCL8|nr:MAG: hypothetical protein CEE37_07285 [candidate division LCP-89 bacterium B3_LCP]